MRIGSILLVVVSFFFSCSSGKPGNDILPREKMQVVIIDLLRADELINNYIAKDTTIKRDSISMMMYEQVFLINKTDKETFFKSFNYYQAHPQKNRELFDSLISWGARKRIPA